MKSNQNRLKEIIKGCLLVIGINVLIEIICFIMLGGQSLAINYNVSDQILLIPLFIFLLIGIFQFIYVSPLIVYLLIKQKLDLMQGVIIGALVTILLNMGVCFLTLGLA